MKRRTFLEAARAICIGSYFSATNSEARPSPRSWSVVGMGCGGCNMAQTFATLGLPGNGFVSFVSSDSVALAYHARVESYQYAKTNKQFHLLGESGFEMGSNSELGKTATTGVIADLLPTLARSEIVFVLVGLGGGTGSGGAPVIAAAAKSFGAVVVALVTLPFDFEGDHRRANAIASLDELRRTADHLAVLELQGLLTTKYCNSPQDVAFKAVDHAMIAYANRVLSGSGLAAETRIAL